MKANILLVFVSIIISFLLFEAGLRLYSPNRNSHRSTEYTLKNLQYLGPKKSYEKILKSKNGKIIDRYRINYDSRHRRQTPQKKEAIRAHLFFGCSFVFGFGLDDNETLPWLVAEKSELQTYNYAQGGNGPNDMLALMNDNDLNKQISSKIKKVDASFHSYSFHTGRYLGTFHKIGGARVNSPYFEIQNEKLEYRGSFSKGRPIKTFIFWLLYHSRLAREIIWTSKETLYGKDSQQTICQLVNQSFFKLKQQFKDRFGNFYFSISPLQRKFYDPYIINYYKGVKSCLDRGIIVLDFPKNREEYEANREKFQILPNEDSHPGKYANQWYSDLLLDAMAK